MRMQQQKVRLNGRESKAFSVKVGMHQESVLSPLLWHHCAGSFV